MRRIALLIAVVALVAACSNAGASPPAPTVTTTALAALSAPQATTTTSSITTTTVAPTTVPPPTTTTEPPRRRLVISGTGDVNLDPGYIPALADKGYDHAWAGLDGLFLADDLTVVNLECAPSDLGSALPKRFTFRCDPAALPAMRAAGVEVANLGNNHSRDFGPDAMLDGVSRLQEAGIAAVGVGADAAAAHQPALFDVGGWRVAVLGFGGIVPTPDWIAGPDHPGMADGDTIDTMVAAVRAADEVADLVFVAIHWGVELDTEPRPDDVARAEAMIDAGADGIFGHHAHRLQPLTFYEGKPIAWGLGNFVWPDFSVAGSTTAVARFVVEPDGTVGACLVPAFIESPGHPVLTGEPPC